MVVAANQPAGPDGFGAYGVAEKSVTVKKEVMVLATLPRVLSPGEESDVPVSVLYIGDRKQTVPVSLSPGGQLGLVGAASQNVVFDGSGEKIVNFRVKAKDLTGIGMVRVSAKGATDSAVQDIELDIRQPTTPITLEAVPGADGGGTALSAGQTWTLDRQALPGFAGSNTVRLELSTMPPIDLGKRLDYLIQYPHGCIEQTTSSVFPQLYLADLMDLAADRQAEIQKNVEAGITRLRDFQQANGGFSYWPNESGEASAWGSSYAGHFLLEAKRSGYAVPAGMLDGWASYQREAANNWNDKTPAGKLDQAYRLYTLALNGSADLAALNRLKESSLSDQATWRLAAAYLLVGQTQAARDLVKKAGTAVKKYRELGGTFGSDIRDKAMILESLTLLELNTQALGVARELSGDLAKDQWLSTQETAYALLALSRITGLLAGNGQIRASFSLKDSAGFTLQKTVSTAKPILISPVRITGSATEIQFSVKNEGSTPVFPRLLMTGTPAPGSEKDQKQGLALKVRYYDAGGTEITPLDNLSPGSDVYAEILVQNLSLTQAYEQLALTHLVPSGFEIINDRMAAAGQDAPAAEGEGSGGSQLLPSWFKRTAKIDSKFEYQDVRDDRILTYFGLPKLGQKLFRVHLVAAYKGRYYLPSIKAEAMYDAAINAQASGFWMGIGERAAASNPPRKN
jgi:uncharacterized protein YfaS (alpha-2-macroglobulin family)